MEGENNAGSIIDAIERLSGHELVNLDGDVKAMILPSGKQLVSIKKLIDEYQDQPERRKGTASVTTLRSFAELVNRFKSSESAVFVHADQREPHLVAVIDYNPNTSDNADARFGEHRVKYDFPLSSEWRAWRDQNEKPMDMEAFARFLEDRIIDIIHPDSVGEKTKPLAAEVGITPLATPAKMMELSRGISIRVDGKVTEVRNPSSGERSIVFSEGHTDEAGQPLKVPLGFCIQIPVFRQDVTYQVLARLRYRAKPWQPVTWTYSLFQVQATFDDAVNIAAADVGGKTELPVYYGLPEK